MAANNSVFRTRDLNKLLAETRGKKALKKVLGPLELMMLGIGAIVGTGIFVLTGTAAANYAGPALILSFIFSGVTCCFAALCYSELAAMIPVAGSAYTFGYVGLGEIWAWMIGWDLLMEYMVAVSAVAVGWSGYIVALIESAGGKLPAAIINPPGLKGGMINLPCILILFVILLFLIRGMTQTAKLNDILVVIKLSVVILFIVVGAAHIKPVNWHPFFPYGVSGVFKGAAIVFFAYIGFDAVSSAAEEVKNPQKDLPIGIIGSLLVCTVLYIFVAAVLTGVLPYYTYKNTAAPVAFALQKIGITWGSAAVSVGAICGLTSVLLVMSYGSTRILFSLSRDGLLPQAFSDVHPKYGTPVKSTIIVGIIVMLLSGFVSLDRLATLTNIGTLFAFIIVSASVIVLRKRRPEYKRPFRCPWVPFVPIMSMILCCWLVVDLPVFTKKVFVIWLAIGLVIYFAYSRRHSVMNGEEEETPSPTDGN